VNGEQEAREKAEQEAREKAEQEAREKAEQEEEEELEEQEEEELEEQEEEELEQQEEKRAEPAVEFHPDEPPVPGVPAPLVLALPRDPCAVGTVDLTRDPVIGDLLDAVEPRNETVQAVAHLSYLVAVAHDMGLSPAYSRLIDHWVEGDWRFDDPALNSRLYCVYRDGFMLPPQQFAKLTAGVLGITMEGLPAGSPVNTAYPRLFDQLIDAFIEFNNNECDRRRGFNPARQAIDVARDSIKANLEANLSGVAMMQIREQTVRLKEALDVFNHPEVIQQVACGQHDHLSAIAGLNGGGRTMIANLVALHQTAIARNDIYNFIAPFQPRTGGKKKRFRRARKAAVTIRTTAKWYAANAGPEGKVMPFPGERRAMRPTTAVGLQ
jgi:hypothetical protein